MRGPLFGRVYARRIPALIVLCIAFGAPVAMSFAALTLVLVKGSFLLAGCAGLVGFLAGSCYTCSSFFGAKDSDLS